MNRYKASIELLEAAISNCNDSQTEEAQEMSQAITVLRLMEVGSFSAIVEKVRQWGYARDIIGENAQATLATQFDKLIEEVNEIRIGIVRENQHEIIDGIGDATVVLIMLADLAKVKFETCLLAAWDEIKDRKGRMIDGKFVKNAEPKS